MFWFYWLMKEDNKVSEVTVENGHSLISNIVFVALAFVFVIFLLAILFI